MPQRTAFRRCCGELAGSGMAPHFFDVPVEQFFMGLLWIIKRSIRSTRAINECRIDANQGLETSREVISSYLVRLLLSFRCSRLDLVKMGLGPQKKGLSRYGRGSHEPGFELVGRKWFVSASGLQNRRPALRAE